MPRKLKLEALEITSFDVLPRPRGALGTVQAHDGWTEVGCAPQTAQPGQSCRPSCFNYTCEGATCALLFC